MRAKLIRSMMFAVFALVAAPSLYAQTGAVPDKDLQLLRKDLRSMKKQLVAANLPLTDAEAPPNGIAAGPVEQGEAHRASDVDGEVFGHARLQAGAVLHQGQAHLLQVDERSQRSRGSGRGESAGGDQRERDNGSGHR